MTGPEKVTTSSPEETADFGRAFAGRLRPGAVVGFVGDLGSGKTCMIQGICRGLGVRGPVTSPTFILVNEYAGRAADGADMPVYHFDLYRLRSARELADLGCDDYFYGPGVCLVEWADLAGGLLPEGTITVRLSVGACGERTVTVEGAA